MNGSILSRYFCLYTDVMLLYCCHFSVWALNFACFTNNFLLYQVPLLMEMMRSPFWQWL